MKLENLISEMIIDEMVQGNIESGVLEALEQIKKLSKQYNLTFNKGRVK